MNSVFWIRTAKSNLFNEATRNQSHIFRLFEADQIDKIFSTSAKEIVSLVVFEAISRFPISELNILREIVRKFPKAMILVILASQVKNQGVLFLDAGADRYLCNESSVRLITAMINSLMNRIAGPSVNSIDYKSLRLEERSQTIFHKDARVHLTHQETLLLGLMLKSRTKYLSSIEIAKSLTLLTNYPAKPELVRLYVHRVNRKIETINFVIKNKRNFGYKLELLNPAPAIKTNLSGFHALSIQWHGIYRSNLLQSPRNKFQ